MCNKLKNLPIKKRVSSHVIRLSSVISGKSLCNEIIKVGLYCFDSLSFKTGPLPTLSSQRLLLLHVKCFVKIILKIIKKITENKLPVKSNSFTPTN